MRKIVHLLLGTALLLSLPASAADVTRGAGTMTRYVLQFGQLERALLDAQAKHDTAAMEPLLGALFETRNASGERVSREDWLKTAGGGAQTGSAPNQLAVYEIGPNAVANFWLGQPGSKDAVFIVDVWVPDGSKWLLRARFESTGH